MMDLDRVRRNLSVLEGWEERYGFIISLGRHLPEMPESDRTEENRVHGCQSRVWLTCGFDPGDGKLRFVADSDAHIVRGLLAIVLAAYSGHTPAEVLATDIRELFQELELESHLSPTRRNGLYSMVRRVQELAAQAS